MLSVIDHCRFSEQRFYLVWVSIGGGRGKVGGPPHQFSGLIGRGGGGGYPHQFSVLRGSWGVLPTSLQEWGEGGGLSPPVFRSEGGRWGVLPTSFQEWKERLLPGVVLLSELYDLFSRLLR